MGGHRLFALALGMALVGFGLGALFVARVVKGRWHLYDLHLLAISLLGALLVAGAFLIPEVAS